MMQLLEPRPRAFQVHQADATARWTAGAHGEQAFFAYSTNHLIDVENAIVVDAEPDHGDPIGGRGCGITDYNETVLVNFFARRFGVALGPDIRRTRGSRLSGCLSGRSGRRHGYRNDLSILSQKRRSLLTF
jgi:hypothetical protein